LKAFGGLFQGKREVEIPTTFRVKEFGPGVGHYVLDLKCSGITHN
jgi:tRNA G37 N-methylase Trm5